MHVQEVKLLCGWMQPRSQSQWLMFELLSFTGHKYLQKAPGGRLIRTQMMSECWVVFVRTDSQRWSSASMAQLCHLTPSFSPNKSRKRQNNHGNRQALVYWFCLEARCPGLVQEILMWRPQWKFVFSVSGASAHSFEATRVWLRSIEVNSPNSPSRMQPITVQSPASRICGGRGKPEVSFEVRLLEQIKTQDNNKLQQSRQHRKPC